MVGLNQNMSGVSVNLGVGRSIECQISHVELNLAKTFTIFIA